MKHIVLVGDSIFDNACYVGEGESVIDQLNGKLPNDYKATLLAVDGDVTSDLTAQLKILPNDTSHLFISCGGNDALRIANVLQSPATSVGDAMELFTKIKTDFQARYHSMLVDAKNRAQNITICTVHDSIPNIEQRAITALALFNEVILREAFSINAPVIDLRLACSEESDYSSISPIEPSKKGANKITDLIVKVAKEHKFENKVSSVYA